MYADLAPDGTALMSVSVVLLPPAADEAGAEEAAADEAGAAADEAGAAADELEDPPPLLVTADEPQADRAATVSAAAAMPAARSRGRPGLRSPAADFRQVCTTITPQWVLGFLVDLGAWPSCAMDCSSYTLRAR